MSRTKKKARKKRKLRLYRYTAYALLFFVLTNIGYGVYKKPSHILTPISHMFKKSPMQTWNTYHETFQRFATNAISASFLAGLAQTESDGNTFATSYWKWTWRKEVFKILHPSSSASGMFQITSPTFKEAKQFCWQDKKVVYEKTKNQRCWMNLFRFRFSAYDSTYLTSARLNYWVRNFNTRYQLNLGKRGKEALAAAIHLCGRNKTERYIRSGRGFHKMNRCGSHHYKTYLSKIRQHQSQFMMLAKN